jgi:hypothetical protein
MTYSLQIVAVETTHTNKDLQEMMVGLYEIVQKSGMGFCLTVSGYDDDPRDLWTIPEALDLFRRLVKIGFISILEVSTMTTMKLDYIPDDCPAFGALEIWSLAGGKIRTGDNEFTENDMRNFLAALKRSNKVCDDLIESGLPGAIKQDEKVNPYTNFQYWRHN